MERNNVNLEVAKFAMECVDNVKDITKEDFNKKYKTLVKKMPAMIQKNGLIGTLVFNLSKISNSQHKEVLKNIIEWNIENVKICDITCKIDNHDFKIKDKLEEIIKAKNCRDGKEVRYIEIITGLNSQDYRLVTKEIMNLFGWIKRFADGMIEGE